MARIYYGYQMVDGYIIVHPAEVKKLREFYSFYLEGETIQAAGQKARILKSHGSLGRLLQQKRYLGTEVYPQLVEEELYYLVQEEREKRRQKMGRDFEPKNNTLTIPMLFSKKEGDRKKRHPFDEAEYQYSLIEVIE